MKLFVQGHPIHVTDKDLLGVGGEGTVYRHGDRAVKVFHVVPSPKIAKIRAFPAGLPANVASPLELVSNPKGAFVGFTMKALATAVDILRLGQRRWREGALGNADVLTVFRRMHTTLVDLHGRGIVVGDLNDGNVVLCEDAAKRPLAPFFIDADSMQLPGFACTVAHERFLDPALYGKDLTRAGAFSPDTDWYAFAVMLFTSLLYVHPYGGQHPSYPTLLRRAEARHSLLRSDVKIPGAASLPGVLPDDLLDRFARVFDSGARGVFPASLLLAEWKTCACCGTEHARVRCPVCSVTVAALREPSVMKGRCRVTTVFETRGRIVHATAHGALRYIYEEDGTARREDGSIVALGPSETVRGDRAFDPTSAALFHVTGDWLVRTSQGTRLGQVLEGQTWVRTGARLGFAFYRAGLFTFHFIFDVAKGGLRQIDLPHIDGRLVDCAATFDDRHVLFCTAVEKDGKRTHAVHLVRDDGAIVATASGSPESSPLLGHLFGKCMMHGLVLAATDDGLLLVRPDVRSRTFASEKLFPETKEAVPGGADILAGPGGSVYVVTQRRITNVALT